MNLVPSPSLKLNAARARLNATLRRKVVSAALAWKKADDCFSQICNQDVSYLVIITNLGI